jgi:hypothetical protein
MAAAGLESLVYEKKSEEKDEEAKPNPPKKPKLDLTKNRPAWVLGSVAEAVRSDGPPATGRGKGRGTPRGGNRGGFMREAGAAIAARREAAGGREAAVREGEALTGVRAGQALLSHWP